MSEHGAYSGAAVYGGVATGTMATASLGIAGEKKGFAGFVAMLIWFVVGSGWSIYCLELFTKNNFNGVMPWVFLALGVVSYFLSLRIAFGFVHRFVAMCKGSIA